MCKSPIGDIHPVTLTGPLTAWDQECRLLFRYYGNLEDSFSLRILDVASCATSSIAMRCSSRQGRSRPVSLSPPCFMPYVQPQPTNVFTPAQAAFWDHCAGETIAWKSLLRRWHFMDDDVHLKRAMCVWVPEPIAALIRRGEWSFLVIARRWLGFDQDSWFGSRCGCLDLQSSGYKWYRMLAQCACSMTFACISVRVWICKETNML